MKPRVISYLFFFVAGINLMAQIFSNPEMNQYTRPLLMPLLIYYVYHTAKGHVTIYRLLVTGALIFSWFGDLLLLYPDLTWSFIAGLGAFLVAQVIYTIALIKATYQKPPLRIRPLLPIFLYGCVLLIILIPLSGDMKVPLSIYLLCILAMVSSARLRQRWTSNESFSLAVYGATLFVISDSILAIDTFTTMKVPQASFLVMLTYISGQYLLVKGILAHPG